MPQHHYIPVRSPISLNQELDLDAERSAYLCRVLRMNEGDAVSCFDGEGLSFQARLSRASVKQAQLQVTHLSPREATPTYELQIAMSMIKGPGQDRAIASAVELGASHVWLFSSSRSNVRLDKKRMQNKVAHWHKTVVAAAEQSGRRFLPPLSVLSMDALRMHIEQHAHLSAIALQAQTDALPSQIERGSYLLLVGPEGGWSDEELDWFEDAGIPTRSLGPYTLRAETVPGVALALLRQAMQHQAGV